jgi:SAM-dependent methyltransferase
LEAYNFFGGLGGAVVKEPDILKCRVCDNTKNNRLFVAREMMFGFRDRFDYSECSRCGCLQIAKIPPNLSKYYVSQDYFSFSPPALEKSSLRRYLKHKRASHALGLKKSIVGSLLVRWPGVPDLISFLKPLGLRFDQPILDVGCGSGRGLLEMHYAGFSNLTGIDSYIKDDIYYPGGVVVLKRTLDEVHSNYDLVMLHHTFEHVPDPLGTLQDIHRLLNKGRFALLRLPVAQSYAWRVYGTDWVQLDAPRHLFLHTEKSIRLLAQRAGFEVTSVVYDSTDFQFWGSEQYKRDIPLRAKESYRENPGRSIFTKVELRTFRAKAKVLNEKGEGDQACFYLRKST